MDAPSPKTSISSGLLIYRLLSGHAGVSQLATKVFPVAITAENARLPFIVFRAVSQDPTETKPQKGFDTCQIAVDCAAGDYEEAVTLAELAREAIEDAECSEDGISLGTAVLTDREEFYDDAFVERLIFTITV